MLFRKRTADEFETLCAPYSGMVYRHCLQMLRSPADAEDAAQETLLRAWRAFDRYRGEGTASWLFRTAHNTCLDILKSASRRHETTLPGDAFPDAPDPSLTPDERYALSTERETLRQAVNRLPEEQQLLLQLYYGEGCGYAELARELGLAEGTVKSRLSRAKEALRKDAALEAFFRGE